MRIALDAMGGDYAPASTVEGAIQAAGISGGSRDFMGYEQALKKGKVK